MMGKASGLPEPAISPTASSVSEKSSVANLPTASSNGPARAGSANTIRTAASASARRRSRTFLNTGLPRRKVRKAATIAAFLVCRWVKLGSGARTEALVGLDVVVAALLADPIADQVPGAVELLRPGVAGDEILGLVDDVELAVALDLADEHRLGDVVVREHLRGAAGQVRRFDARQRVDHLVGIGRLHLLDRLHPHVE